jgi:hypothetical protein
MPRGNPTKLSINPGVLRKMVEERALAVWGAGLGTGKVLENEVAPCRGSHDEFAERQQLQRRRGVRRLRFTALLAMLVSAGSWATAQASATTNDVEAASISTVPARSWSVDATANELAALHHKDSYLRYRMHTVNEKGDRVRDVIESRDGTVARLILLDGKPLTEEEDNAERQRLNDMLASPAAFAKHIRNGDSERRIADRLAPLMPDAMLYSYTPGQPQTGNNNGRLEVVLDYKPNPKFVPPNTEAQALTGLEGRVWIDAQTRHIVRMEGTVSHPVNFGWGMLAHIYPGGKLTLDQTTAGGDRWIFTHFSMTMSVRALMVKTLNVHSNVETSDYQTLPGPMSYQDAIHRLLDTPLPGR